VATDVGPARRHAGCRARTPAAGSRYRCRCRPPCNTRKPVTRARAALLSASSSCLSSAHLPLHPPGIRRRRRCDVRGRSSPRHPPHPQGIDTHTPSLTQKNLHQNFCTSKTKKWRVHTLGSPGRVLGNELGHHLAAIHVSRTFIHGTPKPRTSSLPSNGNTAATSMAITWHPST